MNCFFQWYVFYRKALKFFPSTIAVAIKRVHNILLFSSRNECNYQTKEPMFVIVNSSWKQQCIPAGCVLPARYCTEDLPDRKPPLTENSRERDPPRQRSPGQRPPWTETHLDRDLLDRDHSPWTETPTGQRPPLDRDPHWTETPPDRDPPVWTKWHTGVKTLPCPKLRFCEWYVSVIRKSN